MSGKKVSHSPRPAVDDVFASFDDRTALLALAAPVARGPSPRVRSALRARVRAATAAAASVDAAGWRFAAVAEGESWVPLPFPGVRMREVTIDAGRDTALLYVEMAPGAVFPDHEHAADERGVVLTGDLTMRGRRLGAGGFYEAAAGTRHERIASPSGCTGLLWVGARAWQEWRGKMATG